jgi:membrane protein required for colicin V production
MIDLLTTPAAGVFASTDIIALLVIALLALRGAIRGITKDLIMVGGVVLAIILTRLIGPSLGELITSKIGGKADTLAGPVGYISVFLIVFIITSIIAFFASRFIKEAKFGWADRAIGLVFGIVLGLVICGLCLRMLGAGYQFLDKTAPTSFISNISTGLVKFLVGLKG